jgi:hypothetical protein
VDLHEDLLDRRHENGGKRAYVFTVMKSMFKGIVAPDPNYS